MRTYFVYILSNASRILYIGVTGDLVRRVHQHKEKQVPGFTAKYNVTKLVYFEATTDVRAAIAREKQLKAWTRAKKVALIQSQNPRWRDLAVELGLVEGRNQEPPT